MTKHCSFFMISESRAGSSRKSKSRYDGCWATGRHLGLLIPGEVCFGRGRGREGGWGQRESYVGHLETVDSPRFI